MSEGENLGKKVVKKLTQHTCFRSVCYLLKRVLIVKYEKQLGK